MALTHIPATSADLSATLVSGDVRRHNLAVVARHLLGHGPASRSEIADATGLTRGSVTALTAVLLKAGLLAEAEKPNQRGKGRPRTLLSLTGNHIAIVALQLDADAVTGLVTTLTGATLLRTSSKHGRPMGNPEPVLDLMADVLGQCLDACEGMGRQVADVTVVVFAPVGGDPAVVIADTDLGWGSVDLMGEVRRREPRLPGTARLVGDSILAAQAELSQLADTRDLIYLKSNSGIGGAIISGGSVLLGAQQLAGALGHVPIVPDGELCGCGQHGCLVTVAGPDEILRAAGLEQLLREQGLGTSLVELTARILAGEAAATAAWESAVVWIGRTLQVLSVALDPQIIVLGGYWAELAESVEESFKRNQPGMELGGGVRRPAVLAGKLAGDAALLGAVWASRDMIMADPLSAAI